MGNSEDAVAAAAKKAPVEVPPARLPKAPEPAAPYFSLEALMSVSSRGFWSAPARCARRRLRSLRCSCTASPLSPLSL